MPLREVCPSCHEEHDPEEECDPYNDDSGYFEEENLEILREVRPGVPDELNQALNVVLSHLHWNQREEDDPLVLWQEVVENQRKYGGHEGPMWWPPSRPKPESWYRAKATWFDNPNHPTWRYRRALLVLIRYGVTSLSQPVGKVVR